ncbi:MAG: peroxiredoxin [Acidimicrobiales bacterium]
MLDAGTRAPRFTLPDQDGVPLSLEALRGRWVLLWWYPKAGTLGCTIEGQMLRDRRDEFAAAGCTVVGVSFDTNAENKAWSDAQGFGFRLLSDTDHQVGRAYEVEREPDDQYAAFPLRVSYLIDADGVICKTFAVSGVADHASAVLDTLAELRAS